MGFTTSRRGGLQAEINVTPLVDVVLVLLIIFLVIVPLTLHGYDVDIPGQATAEPSPEVDAQVVLAIGDTCSIETPLDGPELPGDCRVRVNDELVPASDLARRMAELYGPRAVEDRVLFLAAEDSLNYEGVMRVVDVARSRVPELRIALLDAPPPEPR